MSQAGEAIRVLHVDDHADFADLVATFLEREDDRLDVVTATTPEEGLEILADRDVDCIVSDYDMPATNGIGFLEAVREEHPELPFILYTGKGSEEVASEAISAGVTDYLQKGSGTSQYAVLRNRITNAVDQHRSKREAEASRERLSLFFDQSPLGVVEWNEEFEFVRANEKAEEILGYAEEELRGNSWEMIVPDADRAPVEEVVAQLLEAEGGYHSINENVRADGEVITCEWHNRVVTDEAGETVAVFSQFRDVTERVERERELEGTNALLSTLFETLPVGVTVLDTDGRIVRANRRAEEVLGLVESDSTDRTYDDPEWEIFGADGEPVPEEELPFARVMETGESVFGYEHGIERRDGRERWLSVNATPITDEGGEIEQVVTTIADVTEAREYERAIEAQNERLEEFTSVVSHDLRNPLDVARGRLELAREECDSEHLEAVERAHERMAALITDLLALAREGDAATEVTAVDLGALVEGCWGNVDTKDATLVADVDLTVRADEGRLRQLFENLIGNSVEHGGPDVTVTVGERADGFYVEDDGPGIPEGDREAVFEAGYTTSDRGTGFGLSIVRQIAEAHGWTVSATEGEDGGARFEITGVEFVPGDDAGT